MVLLILTLLVRPAGAPAAWCTSSCRKGALKQVERAVANVSAEFCPAQSHGLYKLHADLKRDPLIAPSNDLIGEAGPDCRVLQPPLPPTYMCVYPPQQDTIISRGVIWRGHWASDCNEEYRIRTLCAIVAAVRRSNLGSRAWVLDVGSNIGTFTIPLIAAGVNVIAVEADADNIALLQGSLAAQRRMHAAATAAAAVSGATPPPPLGASRLVGHALASQAGLTLCMERKEHLNSGSVQFRALPGGGGGASSRASSRGPSGGAAGAGSAAGGCNRLVRTSTLDLAVVSTAGLNLGGSDGVRFVAMKIDVQGSEAGGASSGESTSTPDEGIPYCS